MLVIVAAANQHASSTNMLAVHQNQAAAHQHVLHLAADVSQLVLLLVAVVNQLVLLLAAVAAAPSQRVAVAPQ